MLKSSRLSEEIISIEILMFDNLNTFQQDFQQSIHILTENINGHTEERWRIDQHGICAC